MPMLSPKKHWILPRSCIIVLPNLKEILQAAITPLNNFRNTSYRLETYSRRCNLKFNGVAESTGERCLAAIEGVLSEMDIDSSDIGIVVAHRIGKYSAKPVRPRSIIVQFEDFADRFSCLANRSKFKGSETYVCEDFPN